MFIKRFQLGLLHVAVAMTLVPINSTLNRVMIKELSVSATLVAIMASLPYLFSPIQVAIGSFSDRYPVWGYRRSPYIFLGLILCVTGVIVSPYVAFLLVQNRGLGIFLGILAFGAWGMGYNLASVSYLSLATEISGEEGRSKTIATMFIMMIIGIILTSITLGNMLEVYNEAILIQAFRVVGLIALVMGLAGLFRLEEKKSAKDESAEIGFNWKQIYTMLTGNKQVTRFFWYLTLLLTAILGQDILLEPYGAQAFGLAVNATTKITAIWGVCFLISMSIGAAVEKKIPKMTQAKIGGWAGIGAFSLIVISTLILNLSVFYSGVILLGLATGISTVSNLSLMLDMTTTGNVGMFIGAWGMANAISRLAGNMLSGIVRDTVTVLTKNEVAGYSIVFFIEILMLISSLLILRNVNIDLFKKQSEDNLSFIERAAIAGEG